MNYYQFHIADWALHTSHLTLEEEGVYRRLLDHYYDTESPIPEETQSVIRRLRLGSYEETVALILDEFFDLVDGFWRNSRADREIAEYQSKAKTARENGKRGGRPKKKVYKKQELTENEKPEKTQSVILANPEETGSKANQEPRTKNHKPRTINQENNIPGDKSPSSDKSDNSACDEVIDYLNARCGTSYRKIETNRNLIRPRLRDHSIGDCKTVIDKKSSEWLGTEWEKYLRPSTLFKPSKFEGYLNQSCQPTQQAQREIQVDAWVQGGVDNQQGEVIEHGDL